MFPSLNFFKAPFSGDVQYPYPGTNIFGVIISGVSIFIFIFRFYLNIFDRNAPRSIKDTRDVETLGIYLQRLSVNLHAGFDDEFGAMVDFNLKYYFK